jgi:NADPH2:quinone reductase
MTLAVQIDQTGGPEQLKLVDVTVGDPGPGEIRIRHKAIGLNFIDVYQRSGLYPFPMPLKLGMEGAGIVEAVGAGVTHLKVGDRAAYASQPPGSYCEVRVMPAKCVCVLPDAISFETGAAMMLKGLTAQYLLKKTLPVEGLKHGDYVLFHAAAGGVGLIACQWAKALGLQLIGTAGSDEKCALALANGAAHAINYRTEDFAARVKDITGGAGVKVVYDSVGKDTLGQVARLPAPLRPDGQLRQCLRASAPVCPGQPGRQGLDLRDAPDPVQPHHHARGDAGHGRRPVCRGAQRPGEDPHRAALPAGAGAGRAPGAGGAPDHRVHHPDALTQPPGRGVPAFLIAIIAIANYDHFAMGCGHFQHQMMPKTPAGRSQAAPGAGFSVPGAPAAVRPGSARLRPR